MFVLRSVRGLLRRLGFCRVVGRVVVVVGCTSFVGCVVLGGIVLCVFGLVVW